MTDFKNVVGMGNKSERLLLIDITAQQHGTNSSSSLSVHQPVNEASLQRKAFVDTVITIATVSVVLSGSHL